MSNPQVLGATVAAPAAAAVLPNTGAFHYVVIAGLVLAAVGAAFLAVQLGKSVVARNAAK